MRNPTKVRSAPLPAKRVLAVGAQPEHDDPLCVETSPLSEDPTGFRDDLPVIASSIATVVAAVAAVKIDHNLATVATAAGAVVTALIGYRKASRADANARAVARIGADATLDTNARTVLVQTITSERAVWRWEMRSAAAELSTILCEPDPTPARDWTRVDRQPGERRAVWSDADP